MKESLDRSGFPKPWISRATIMNDVSQDASPFVLEPHHYVTDLIMVVKLLAYTFFTVACCRVTICPGSIPDTSPSAYGGGQNIHPHNERI